MLLEVKSNGRQVNMTKEVYDKLPEDQKRAYNVLNKEDVSTKDQVVENKKEANTDKK